MAERFFSYVRSLAPGIKYDPVTGQVSLNISLGAISQPKTTLKEIFEYLENLRLEKRAFDDNLAELPEMQKQVLIAIAKEGKVKEVTSSGFVLRHSLRSSSTVQSAPAALYAKEFVSKNGGFYSITNRFFRFYLLDRYGSGFSI